MLGLLCLNSNVDGKQVIYFHCELISAILTANYATRNRKVLQEGGALRRKWITSSMVSRVTSKTS